MTPVKRIGIVAAILAVSWLTPARAERETVDEVIAVVGDTVILGSEVANQMRMYLFQTKHHYSRISSTR
jgi:hypothetical protein